VIWDGYGADSKATVTLSDPLSRLDDAGWHTWALRWTPTGLTFYYDDAQIGSTTGPISRRNQYIVLSSEVGRFFGGEIPAAGYGSRETSTTTMQVDYVRVWEASTQDDDVDPPVPPPIAPQAAAPALQPLPLSFPPPAPPPAVDTTAPKARISGRRSQKVRGASVVTISCPDEACRATATGSVRVPMLGRLRAKTHRTRTMTTAIAKGTRRTLEVKLAGSARAPITQALRAGKRIVLKLSIRVTDSAGNARTLTRQVVLKP
jgi:hypothetical protein